MKANDIITQLRPLFLDVIELDDLVLTPDTSADDIKAWDSLTHIQLIVAIEKHFNIKFTATEIQSFRNVGEMCECIAAHMGK